MSPQEITELVAKLSPWGLAVFMIVWSTLKTQPAMERRMDQARTEFLKALADLDQKRTEEGERARKDFLGSLADQRSDFVNERAYDRKMKESLADAIHKLVESNTETAHLLQEHTLEARAVWKTRGDLPT